MRDAPVRVHDAPASPEGAEAGRGEHENAMRRQGEGERNRPQGCCSGAIAAGDPAESAAPRKKRRSRLNRSIPESTRIARSSSADLTRRSSLNRSILHPHSMKTDAMQLLPPRPA